MAASTSSALGSAWGSAVGFGLALAGFSQAFGWISVGFRLGFWLRLELAWFWFGLIWIRLDLGWIWLDFGLISA